MKISNLTENRKQFSSKNSQNGEIFFMILLNILNANNLQTKKTISFPVIFNY